MEITTTRTLVKSTPELWELLDDEPQLRHWSAHLCGGGDSVRVLARKPEEELTWRSDGPTTATVTVSMAEKGLGTQVEISAEADGRLRRDALESVLDDLAEPQRRPFSAL
jgi:hypothetical protein